jgi:hypothetical protein
MTLGRIVGIRGRRLRASLTFARLRCGRRGYFRSGWIEDEMGTAKYGNHK